MIDLPTALYDAAGARALDDRAIRIHGIDGYELMSRAGAAAWDTARRLWPGARRIVVVCGKGNNGGDGYVVAALAARDGLSVEMAALGEPRSDESARARRFAAEQGVDAVPIDDVDFGAADLVVDGVLGTGLAQAPADAAAVAIGKINACASPVLALDIPSGLDSDTGCAPGVAVKARATCTFIGLKLGLVTGVGPELAGEVVHDGLGVPAAVFDEVPCAARRIDRTLVESWLPRRSRCAHKGEQGHVMLVGGNEGMTGALRIAAEAAARSGAGLVTAATRSRHAMFINIAQPEIMVSGVDDGDALTRMGEGRQAIGIGPGLGLDEWAASLLDRALAAGVPMVADADALNLLAAGRTPPPGTVLTPHPGEAARLLGVGTREISRDRPGSARDIARRYRCVCVLKGCGTVVTDGDVLYVCDRGNPGMATGGMGDCLTGIITALLGRGLAPLRAAVCGTRLHAAAADLEAAAHGMAGMLATDLLPHLRTLLEPHDD
ncbi:MAG: NAD(P)H-hydrate dehydratase [Gammaproteobacteria bacterium]|nr:NAD(P)H-hydrate dehydratase [Gammaproteobacteria bacterium]